MIPFISEDLFEALTKKIGDKQVWDITEADLKDMEKIMIEMTAKAQKK